MNVWSTNTHVQDRYVYLISGMSRKNDWLLKSRKGKVLDVGIYQKCYTNKLPQDMKGTAKTPTAKQELTKPLRKFVSPPSNWTALSKQTCKIRHTNRSSIPMYNTERTWHTWLKESDKSNAVHKGHKGNYSNYRTGRQTGMVGR